MKTIKELAQNIINKVEEYYGTSKVLNQYDGEITEEISNALATASKCEKSVKVMFSNLMKRMSEDQEEYIARMRYAYMNFNSPADYSNWIKDNILYWEYKYSWVK